MADQVKMVSKTVFSNDRITVFRKSGPIQGETGVPATVGDEFTTDAWHGKELARLGHADPLGWSLDDAPDHVLEPHHQVSVDQLRADEKRRGPDTLTAAVVQANRADTGKAVTEAPLTPPATTTKTTKTTSAA